MTNSYEYKLVRLRECPKPSALNDGCSSDAIAKYFREFIEAGTNHNKEVESLYVVMLNSRNKITGFVLASQGILDTLLVHAREVFRPAIVAGAKAIVMIHNHPSGDFTPSESDIKVTRDLIRAGQILGVELLDHLIMGIPDNNKGFCSLREMGYFYS